MSLFMFHEQVGGDDCSAAWKCFAALTCGKASLHHQSPPGDKQGLQKANVMLDFTHVKIGVSQAAHLMLRHRNAPPGRRVLVHSSRISIRFVHKFHIKLRCSINQIFQDGLWLVLIIGGIKASPYTSRFSLFML